MTRFVPWGNGCMPFGREGLLGNTRTSADGAKKTVDEDRTNDGCYTVLHGDPKAANFFYNRAQYADVVGANATSVGDTHPF